MPSAFTKNSRTPSLVNAFQLRNNKLSSTNLISSNNPGSELNSEPKTSNAKPTNPSLLLKYITYDSLENELQTSIDYHTNILDLMKQENRDTSKMIDSKRSDDLGQITIGRTANRSPEFLNTRKTRLHLRSSDLSFSSLSDSFAKPNADSTCSSEGFYKQNYTTSHSNVVKLARKNQDLHSYSLANTNYTESGHTTSVNDSSISSDCVSFIQNSVVKDHTVSNYLYHHCYSSGSKAKLSKTDDPSCDDTYFDHCNNLSKLRLKENSRIYLSNFELATGCDLTDKQYCSEDAAHDVDSTTCSLRNPSGAIDKDVCSNISDDQQKTFSSLIQFFQSKTSEKNVTRPSDIDTDRQWDTLREFAPSLNVESVSFNPAENHCFNDFTFLEQYVSSESELPSKLQIAFLVLIKYSLSCYMNPTSGIFTNLINNCLGDSVLSCGDPQVGFNTFLLCLKSWVTAAPQIYRVTSALISFSKIYLLADHFDQFNKIIPATSCGSSNLVINVANGIDDELEELSFISRYEIQTLLSAIEKELLLHMLKTELAESFMHIDSTIKADAACNFLFMEFIDQIQGLLRLLKKDSCSHSYIDKVETFLRRRRQKLELDKNFNVNTYQIDTLLFGLPSELTYDNQLYNCDSLKFKQLLSNNLDLSQSAYFIEKIVLYLSKSYKTSSFKLDSSYNSLSREKSNLEFAIMQGLLPKYVALRGYVSLQIRQMDEQYKPIVLPAANILDKMGLYVILPAIALHDKKALESLPLDCLIFRVGKFFCECKSCMFCIVAPGYARIEVYPFQQSLFQSQRVSITLSDKEEIME